MSVIPGLMAATQRDSVNFAYSFPSQVRNSDLEELEDFAGSFSPKGPLPKFPYLNFALFCLLANLHMYTTPSASLINLINRSYEQIH